MLKMIRWIRLHLPISRKEYFNTMKKITLTFQAMAQSEAQHAQIEMNMMQAVEKMGKGAGGVDKGKAPKDKDPAFN